MGEILETGTILDKIVARKLVEVEKLKQMGGGASGQLHAGPSRNLFLDALTDKERPGRPIIAEIKRASPSAGVLREPFNPEVIAKLYEKNGARCISVITDEEFFQGSMEIFEKVRETTRVPLLRKDFIIDDVQIEDAARFGADAVLLITRILSDELLQRLFKHALSHEMAALIEVHDEAELDRALSLDPRPMLIGVNNRDLADFSVNLSRTTRLLPKVPKDVVLVSESGLANTRVLDELMEAGVSAFLIGTALMKADDIGGELYKLVFE